MSVQAKSKKEEIQSELSRLLPQLNRVIQMIQDAEEGWTDHYNRRVSEEMYQRRMNSRIGDLLDDAAWNIAQMTAPVIDEGRLSLNSAKRYELPSGEYFTSGSSIEYLAPVFTGDPPEWQYSRVEHNGEDYYIVSDPKLPMSGLRVRVKRVSRH